MQSFGDQTATPDPLAEPKINAIAPDDPSIVEPEEVAPPVHVPEGVSEADFLEQILPG